MEVKELNEALEGLKKDLEGKSKTEVKDAIEAFKTKHKEIFETNFSELLETESKKIKDDFDAELKTLKEENEKAIKAVQEHADKLDIKLQKGGIKKSNYETLVDEVKEQKDALKKVAEGYAGDIEVKALTTRGSITNNASGFFLPEIGKLGVKERVLYNILPKVSVSDKNNSGVIRYRDWDEATTVRAAGMVAEGAVFPESTAKFQWYTKDLRKVGDTLPVTEEFFEDEAQAASELQMFLDINVTTKIDDQIVNGDNTGQNLDGIINTSPAYTAVASGISAPNLKDLAIKVKNDITRTRGSKYRPDMMVVASSTMEDLVLAKDANNNYIFDENTGTIGGLFVVVDENMPDNQVVIGDRRYAKIYEKAGVVISKGTPNNQFNEDEMTIKARRRLLLLVREVDKTGFRKVTDVDAALVTLAL